MNTNTFIVCTLIVILVSVFGWRLIHWYVERDAERSAQEQRARDLLRRGPVAVEEAKAPVAPPNPNCLVPTISYVVTPEEERHIEQATRNERLRMNARPYSPVVTQKQPKVVTEEVVEERAPSTNYLDTGVFTAMALSEVLFEDDESW